MEHVSGWPPECPDNYCADCNGLGYTDHECQRCEGSGVWLCSQCSQGGIYGGLPVRHRPCVEMNTDRAVANALRVYAKRWSAPLPNAAVLGFGAGFRAALTIVDRKAEAAELNVTRSAAVIEDIKAAYASLLFFTSLAKPGLFRQPISPDAIKTAEVALEGLTRWM